MIITKPFENSGSEQCHALLEHRSDKRKRTANDWLPFWRRYIYLGCNKNKIYWGVYVYYTSMNNEESVHKISCK